MTINITETTTDFKVGDRVRVISAHENGYEGVIESLAPSNGDDCKVAIDGKGLSLSYRFKNLVKIITFEEGDLVKVVGNTEGNPAGNHHFEIGEIGTVEQPYAGDDKTVTVRAMSRDFGQTTSQMLLPQDLALVEEVTEEPLAEWEKELLEGSTFKEGDIVVIDVPAAQAGAFEKWQGLRFVLKSISGTFGMPFLANAVIDTRPDGSDSDFYWEMPWLRAFDSTRDFKAGDLIEADRYGVDGKPAKGVVTDPEIFLGGDIEVDWTEGPATLVAYGPIGSNRRYLRLVGVKTEPQPIHEDWTFEAGQEIGSSDVLEDLPVGTVLIVNGDETAPIITLNPSLKDQARFGRLNRFGAERQSRLLGYREDLNVQRAADGKGVVTIAFVPSV